jgi:threonyl-tRNA synthetase
VGKKIHEAEVMKVPYTLVIGPKEVESGQVAPRVRSDLGEQSPAELDDFLNKLSHDAQSRR